MQKDTVYYQGKMQAALDDFKQRMSAIQREFAQDEKQAEARHAAFLAKQKAALSEKTLAKKAAKKEVKVVPK